MVVISSSFGVVEVADSDGVVVVSSSGVAVSDVVSTGLVVSSFSSFCVVWPDGTSVSDYPNTDSYQNGKVKRTGHVIDLISKSADTMTFRFINGKDKDKFGEDFIFGVDDNNEKGKLKVKGSKKKSKRIKNPPGGKGLQTYRELP